jgi:ComF family protein
MVAAGVASRVSAGLRTGRRGLRFVADVVWPPQSLLSHTRTDSGGTVELDLWRALDRLAGPVCGRCGVPMPEAIDPEPECARCIARPPKVGRMRGALAYDDLSRPMVLALKHAGRRDGLAAFAAWMEDAAPFVREAQVLVPVPSHPWRLWQRGYNPAAWLAQALARRTGVPARVDGLIKTRFSKTQAGRDFAARHANVTGSFAVPRPAAGAIAGRAVVLVDDVYTTGATLEACASALLAAGASRVDAVTLARVVRTVGGQHVSLDDSPLPIPD